MESKVADSISKQVLPLNYDYQNKSYKLQSTDLKRVI